jgi:hypothetical protein
MSNKQLLKRFALPEEALDLAVAQAMGDLQTSRVAELYNESVKDFAPNSLINGTILRVVNDDVMVDIGYKSEGPSPAPSRRPFVWPCPRAGCRTASCASWPMPACA